MALGRQRQDQLGRKCGSKASRNTPQYQVIGHWIHNVQFPRGKVPPLRQRVGKCWHQDPIAPTDLDRDSSNNGLSALVAKAGPTLLDIRLVSGAILSGGGVIDDQILSQVAKHCPNLERLDLYTIPGITDTGILAV